MRLAANPELQLTYCTNIHPSNGLEDVRASLHHVGSELRQRLAPDAPFGIGLRLSGTESAELLTGNRLNRFVEELTAQGLYVFTINGFPHGPFHDQPVKDQVHAPDWRNEERVQYTLRLATILAALLPEGGEGGISTSPLSYKPWLKHRDDAMWRLLAHNIARVAAALVTIYKRQGRLIHLDIEPEPDGLIETSVELVAFFEQWLLTEGAAELSRSMGLTLEQAHAALLEHIRVCFDTCHVALEYEQPAEVLARLAACGIRVGKIQVSSALRLLLPDKALARTPLAEALHSFVEPTYLHQVVQRNRDSGLTQFADLPDALPKIGSPEAAEWRVHFHVPIFLDHYGLLGSTQQTILDTFAALRQQPCTGHLEIETYTWSVLPPDLKLNLIDSIEREYRWVLAVV